MTNPQWEGPGAAERRLRMDDSDPLDRWLRATLDAQGITIREVEDSFRWRAEGHRQRGTDKSVLVGGA